ncbi:hypothetical protein ABIE62_000682 [Porphyrobacter sp. MBR-155]|jgi:hypothetical protein
MIDDLVYWRRRVTSQSHQATLQRTGPAVHSMNQPWLTISDCPVNALVFAPAK